MCAREKERRARGFRLFSCETRQSHLSLGPGDVKVAQPAGQEGPYEASQLESAHALRSDAGIRRSLLLQEVEHEP